MPRLARVATANRFAVFHVLLGALVCIVLPLVSYADGSGRLAYNMFSAMRQIRLEVIATNPSGATFEVPPTELGRFAGGAASQFFAGTERFRRRPAGLQPRVHLHDIGSLACRMTGAATVDVRLFERPDDVSAVESFSRHEACLP